jgi:hypothetical protein
VNTESHRAQHRRAQQALTDEWMAKYGRKPDWAARSTVHHEIAAQRRTEQAAARWWRGSSRADLREMRELHRLPARSRITIAAIGRTALQSRWEACKLCGTEYATDSVALCQNHRLCASCHESDGITPRRSLCTDECGGCSCHLGNSAPCSHCTDNHDAVPL